ncbi:MAG: hypothetical protein MI976_21270 [Pseudomonadales bacterium]|nr:hypothetical protein [Pseudomonadales bacterium]
MNAPQKPVEDSQVEGSLLENQQFGAKLQDKHLILGATTLAAVILTLCLLYFDHKTEHQFKEHQSIHALKHHLKAIEEASLPSIITDQSHWSYFKEHVDRINQLHQLARSGKTLTSLRNEDLLQLDLLAVATDALIVNQSIFIKTRSQIDSIEFRSGKIADSAQLIFNSITQSAKVDANLNRIYRLLLNAKELTLLINLYWSTINQNESYRDSLREEMRLNIQELESLVKSLLAPIDGLKIASYRRELLTINNDLNNLNVSHQKIEKSFDAIQKAYQKKLTIDELALRVIAANQPSDSKQFSPALYLITTICFVSLLTLMMIVPSTRKQRGVIPTNASTPPRMASTQAHQPLQMTFQESLEPLIETLDQVTKGKISLRADERNIQTKAVAQALNQFLSVTYRKIIDLKRALEILNLAAHESSSEYSPEKATAIDQEAQILERCIDHTFRIEAHADRLTKKLSKTPQNYDSTLPLLDAMDEEQALIRVKLRDYLALSSHSDNSECPRQDLTEFKAAIDKAMKTINFFKLERRV